MWKCRKYAESFYAVYHVFKMAVERDDQWRKVFCEWQFFQLLVRCLLVLVSENPSLAQVRPSLSLGRLIATWTSLLLRCWRLWNQWSVTWTHFYTRLCQTLGSQSRSTWILSLSILYVLFYLDYLVCSILSRYFLLFIHYLLRLRDWMPCELILTVLF